MTKAFVLGAGLGTRLKRITETLPKPLIPVHQKPLITYAFDHLIDDTSIREFIVNTHHRPEAYGDFFPDGTYRGCPIEFRFEPVLLETAGGIMNVADLLGDDEPFAVYNGDIMSDVPLRPAMEHHLASGNEVTLVLRRSGPALQVALDESTGRIVDIRNYLETGSENLFQFTGLYFVNPAFFRRLTPGRKESVIPIFLQMIREGVPLGGHVAETGHWWDLGTRGSYLRASAALTDPGIPAYGRQPEQQRIHPGVTMEPHAHVCPLSCVSEGCVIGEGAHVDNSILWPGARVAPHASLRNTIVTTGQKASGIMVDEDV